MEYAVAILGILVAVYAVRSHCLVQRLRDKNFQNRLMADELRKVSRGNQVAQVTSV